MSLCVAVTGQFAVFRARQWWSSFKKRKNGKIASKKNASFEDDARLVGGSVLWRGMGKVLRFPSSEIDRLFQCKLWKVLYGLYVYIYIFLKGRIEDQKWKIIHPSIRDTFMGRGIPRRRDRQAYHSRCVGEGIPRRIFVRIGSNDASINPLRNPSLDFRGSRFARYIASNSD